MVRDSLFEGLPPPSSLPDSCSQVSGLATGSATQIPAPKTAIKRLSSDNDEEGTKHVRFKTTVEASLEQLIAAMKKISTHIGNPAKFCKASKLALQLLQAGSVTKETADSFFEVLRAAMCPPSSATEPSLREDYHELFSSVSEHLNCFNPGQQDQIQVWLLWAQVANDLFTDDTFVFSKAAGRIKQAISSLPVPSLEEETCQNAIIHQSALSNKKFSEENANHDSPIPDSDIAKQLESESDPFGLNALLPNISKKEGKEKRRKKEEITSRIAEEEAEKLMREQREALMECLKLAAGRYKFPWAQTIIDILVKHAFDNIYRFTIQQRDAIDNLWASIREQNIRRKQGKTPSGNLDITAFERLQKIYAHEKISIRHAVGASGDRKTEQWLG